MISPNERKIEKTVSMDAKKRCLFKLGWCPQNRLGSTGNPFFESASINVEKDFGILPAARRASGSWLIVGRSPWISRWI